MGGGDGDGGGGEQEAPSVSSRPRAPPRCGAKALRDSGTMDARHGDNEGPAASFVRTSAMRVAMAVAVALVACLWGEQGGERGGGGGKGISAVI